MQHFNTTNIFLSNATCPCRLHGPPSWLWPKCNRLLRLGHKQGVVTSPQWCEWWWWYVWAWSTRTGLKPKFYELPDHGHCGELPLQGKIPTADPGIEPGTSWLVVRSTDHQATRLVTINNITVCNVMCQVPGKLVHWNLGSWTPLFTNKFS
jgi:hypothetical protein